MNIGDFVVSFIVKNNTYIVDIYYKGKSITMCENYFFSKGELLDDLYTRATTYTFFNTVEDFAKEFNYEDSAIAKKEFCYNKLAYNELVTLLGEDYDEFIEWYADMI